MPSRLRIQMPQRSQRDWRCPESPKNIGVGSTAPNWSPKSLSASNLLIAKNKSDKLLTSQFNEDAPVPDTQLLTISQFKEGQGGYDALWQNDPRKRRWREVGLLQKSPQQAWVFKGRLPGFATIGFGG